MAFEDVFNSDLVDYSDDFENQDKDYYALSNGQVVLVNSLYNESTYDYYGQLVKERYGYDTQWWKDIWNDSKYPNHKDLRKRSTIFLNPSTFHMSMSSVYKGTYNRDLSKLKSHGLKLRELYIEASYHGDAKVNKYDSVGTYMWPESASPARQFMMFYEIIYYDNIQRRLLTNFLKKYYLKTHTANLYMRYIEEAYNTWISKAEAHSINDPERSDLYVKDGDEDVFIWNKKLYYNLHRYIENL